MFLEDYRKARQMGQKEAKVCQSRGGSPSLPVLDEILSEEETCGEVDLGLVDIPMELIVGTRSAGRSQAFSRSFYPLMAEDSEFAHKWVTLCKAHMEEGITDPIKVYEYMHTFYVAEGHKRVSVLRYFGAVNIPAEVTRILPARDGSKASQIYYEYVDFYKLSGVNYLWFSAVGRFARLQAALGKAELSDKLADSADALRQRYSDQVAQLEKYSRRFRHIYRSLKVSQKYSVSHEDILAAAALAKEELLRYKDALKSRVRR